MNVAKMRAAVATTAAVALIGGLSFLFGPSPRAPLAAQPTSEQLASFEAGGTGPDFAALAELVTPGVVRIEATRDVEAQPSGQWDSQIPEQFRRFFQMPQQGQPETPWGDQPQSALAGGSGFLISADGFIATNNHVVENARELRVWLNDGHSYEARVVGTDPTTDVAVIKIDASGLPHLRWGSSEDLRVGAWVMAVGNPGVEGSAPLDYTVTSGIVSAKGRPLGIIRRSLDEGSGGDAMAGYAVENFIQTDAVINPGNSGGPLVNVKGEVVGINTAILSATGYYQGYGFAVPSDLAKHVAADLIDDGHVRRAWLGLSMTAVTPEDQEVFGLPAVAGAVVQSVNERSPAAKAGIREGDVIVAVDGTPVRQSGQLQELMAQHDPGDHVRVEIYRDRAPRTVSVELGEMPMHDAPAAATAAGRARTTAETRLGMEVRAITPELANRFGLEEGTRGVVVTSVDPLGPSGRKGIAAGLQIVEANGHAVSSPADLDVALRDVSAGAAINLRFVDPAGQRRFVNVRAN